MIRYSLRCHRAHEFESWFQDSGSYDRQAKRGLVACPVCDSAKVEKAIMAPRITRKGRGAVAPSPQVSVSSEPAEATVAEPVVLAQEGELRAKLRELRDHIKKTADNVGGKFPDEARKMHYGEIEHRPIYGEASRDEARSLIEEGVEVMPLPMLPDDRN